MERATKGMALGHSFSIHFWAGTDISSALDEAIEIAKKLNEKVQFEFNTTTIIVWPEEDRAMSVRKIPKKTTIIVWPGNTKEELYTAWYNTTEKLGSRYTVEVKHEQIKKPRNTLRRIVL